MSEFRDTVNELVGKMEQGEDGKWNLPDDVAKNLDEPTMYAVTAERRVRDTQSAYTKSRQELKQATAIADGLETRLMGSEVALTKEQKFELNDLKKTNPEKWRAKLNEYEEAGKTQLKGELETIRTESATKGELEVRKDQMAAFSESTGITLTDEIVADELPPRYMKDLEAGKITFEDFLTQAGEFLTKEKVIKGANESTDDNPKTLGDVAGGKEPSTEAQAGDFNETYEHDTIF